MPDLLMLISTSELVEQSHAGRTRAVPLKALFILNDPNEQASSEISIQPALAMQAFMAASVMARMRG